MSGKQYAESFRWALSYLLNDVGDKDSQLAAGLSIHPSTVGRWKRGSLPQSLDHILAVIGRAMFIYRVRQLLEELDHKIEEFAAPGGLRGAIDYFINAGYSYETLSDLYESPESLIGMSEKKCDPRTIERYHKGGKPKMVKYLPNVKIPATVEYRPATEILGKYAEETGMTDEAFYALSTIVGRYLDVIAHVDVIFNDDVGKAIWQDVKIWRKEYEKRNAFANRFANKRCNTS